MLIAVLRFKLPMMLRYAVLFFLLLPAAHVAAEEAQNMQQTDIYFTDDILYCDVQTFDQEAYILKVLAGGSAMTVAWQFAVQEQRSFWLNTSVATIELGRQVLPDLVTKRWLMRDLSGGVVHYTTDVQVAMRFLTEMQHIAVLDTSLLIADEDYVLLISIAMNEGEKNTESWWASWFGGGETVSEVDFKLAQHADVLP